jgi:hypothetical protein
MSYLSPIECIGRTDRTRLVRFAQISLTVNRDRHFTPPIERAIAAPIQMADSKVKSLALL